MTLTIRDLRGLAAFAAVSMCLSAQPVVGSMVISEFMSVNKSTVADADGDFPDWVEIYNVGPARASLSGWALTDNLDRPHKWQFPDVELSAGGFLLVFASGKDRREPTGELHTSFRITSEGEFLALVRPDGTMASQFGPEFPTQVPYASYGNAMSSMASPLLSTGATARYFVPTDDSLGLAWVDPQFDDTGWDSGATPIGYDEKGTPTFADLIATDIAPVMRRINSSVYVRFTFEVGDPAAFSSLLLSSRFEDGFALYLNGREVSRQNTRDELDWEARAARPRPDEDATSFTQVNLSGNIDALRAGRNVLAFHGLNSSRNNTDFLLDAALEAIAVTGVDLNTFSYFDAPTPGWANGQGFGSIAEPPTFSIPSGALADDAMLELASTEANAVIRYTTDDTEPDESSAEYTSAIEISSTSTIKARVFTPDALRSPVVTRNYIRLHSGLRDTSSNLPIMIIDTSRRTVIHDSWTPCFAMVVDRGEDGRADFSEPAQFSGRGGVKKRGSSSANWPKNNFAFEAWDENNEDIDVQMLDMPAESDWILHGPYSDKSLMRNALSYEWSNDIGRYAVRTRYVELYFNSTGGNLAPNHYWGVYVLMEKIKRGPERVDIDFLEPDATEAPDITGGYIFKKDRLDPGDAGFRTSRGQTLAWVYPKERSTEGAQVKTAAQQAYVVGFFNAFEAALYGGNFTDPEEGYAKYIDVDSFIDHHILVEMTKNIDGYRLSTFFYKEKDSEDGPGKLFAGPIWDYNLSLGNANYLEGWMANGWYYPLVSSNDYPFWPRLQQDPAFMARYRERWAQFRAGPLSMENLVATIDAHALEINESQQRNFQKWRILGRYDWPNWFIADTWEQEVEWMTGWLRDRVAWMDAEFTEVPVFSHEGGVVEPGFEFTLSVAIGDIYYTLDGVTDPLGRDGGVAPEAILYGGPITVVENTRVKARTKSGGVWSKLAEEVFITEVAPLAVTEIMYNPPAPPAGNQFSADQFEFIELQNVGATPLDLSGFEFTRGVRFSFDDASVTMLAPGARAVIVRNPEAFVSRYDTAGMLILGEYSGSLGNSGETIELVGALGEVVRLFDYDDAWHPSTDGGGYSLTLIDPAGTITTEALENPASWKPSSVVLGTPGQPDGDVGPAGLVVPGDTNRDARLNVTDPVLLLGLLFGGSAAALPCGGASVTEGGNRAVFDANGDGGVNLQDAVQLLNYLFGAGGTPHVLGVGCVRVEGCEDTCAR